jgi:[ribosomal protein S5]-alanine N-acetyltransferase
MTGIDTFQTERLWAERLRPDHLADLCRMHNDARVMATLGGVRSDAETAGFLDRSVDHWRVHGFGLWTFRDKATDAFVARAGLRHVKINDEDRVELAYALMTEFWDRGLATEIGRTILELGRARLNLVDVVAFTLVTNRASRHVMEKLGLLYQLEFVHDDEPHTLYRTAQ